jgi:hypothetical protein
VNHAGRFAVAAALVLMAGTAQAQSLSTPYPGRVEAMVSYVDQKLQVITLDDGTQFWATSAQQISQLKPGMPVTATYVDNGDRKEISTIETVKN